MNRSLSEFSEEPTVATRAAGLEASDLVRGEQAATLLRYLVAAYPDGLSNNELCRKSGIKINAVTARIMELRRVEFGVSRDNLIVPLMRKPDAVTGVVNVVWTVNPLYFVPSRKVVN